MVRNSWLVIGTASALSFVLALYYLWARRARSVPAAMVQPPRNAPVAEGASGDAASAHDGGKHHESLEKAEKRRKKKSKASRQNASRSASGLDVALPSLAFEEDAVVDPTRIGVDAAANTPANVAAPIKPIVFDSDAAPDEPTHTSALMLVSATARTDVGLRRRRNEDAILEMGVEGVFVVADGMGGYRGGDIASSLAVKTIARAFERDAFDGPQHEGVPRRASELARAIQMANAAILERAREDTELEGMGTTVCAARFAANKQRLYVGHVGDSRMYRLRSGKLERLTSDHTMKDLGVQGEGSAYLSRAVGVWPIVPVDLVFCKPVLNDVYLLCSDGLTKMLNDDSICALMKSGEPPARLVRSLVDAANASGGKDNISVIVIRVQGIGGTE